MPPPNRLPAWPQSIIGITLGAIFGLAYAAAGHFRIPTTIYHWLAFYAVLWLLMFFALRRKRTILVVAAFVTCAAIALFTNHYLL